MLQMISLYDTESIDDAYIDRFRQRINAATATATMLARYTEQTAMPDMMDYAMLSMVADGISDILTTAIEEYEENAYREEISDERAECGKS